MARDLQSTPEGQLIRRVREAIRPRLSIPDAAQKAHVGEATWGNTERGYRPVGKGQPPVPFSPSKKILAHMAYALGIAPAELDRVDRQDAADVLREMQGPDSGDHEVVEVEVERGVMLVTVPPHLSEEDREQVRRQAEELAKYLDRRSQEGGG
jgi:hypothetical protein